MGLTSDPTDPRLTHGADDTPVPMAEVYLVLSEEERAKGFVRPLRRSYVHKWAKDADGNQLAFRDEAFKPFEAAETGGCGVETHMGLALCETYAREPTFYGATFCVGCSMHRPVHEFRWAEDGQVVGS